MWAVIVKTFGASDIGVDERTCLDELLAYVQRDDQIIGVRAHPLGACWWWNREATATKKENDDMMNLGQLIDALDACQAEFVRIAAPMPLTPTGVASYRGYYEDLAISYEEGYGPKMRRADFLRTLRAAVGETFVGYKGGEYTMSRETIVWVSRNGESSGARVTGVDVDDDVAYLTLTVHWGK